MFTFQLQVVNVTVLRDTRLLRMVSRARILMNVQCLDHVARALCAPTLMVLTPVLVKKATP